ncbi:MAG: AAA family ATPase [Desulfovibrionaceae bacterium]|nr:AAA family ATPase [Desulfovibrionaceae bacterium]
MYITAVFNQKGGVGKTTTVHNMGALLAAEHNKKVLLLDLDAQGNLTDACGFDPLAQSITTYEVMAQANTVQQAVLPVAQNIDLLPANINLAEAELNFMAAYGRENLLKNALAHVEYDFVLIDCPPSLGLLTINALTAAHGVLIPVQAEYHALAGVRLVRRTVEKVRQALNPSLALDGLLITLYDARKKLHLDVAQALHQDQWGDALFPKPVRTNVKLAEAPSAGQSILAYYAGSNGAHDYRDAVQTYLHRATNMHR